MNIGNMKFDIFILYFTLILWLVILFLAKKRYGFKNLGFYYLLFYAVSFALSIDLYGRMGSLYYGLSLLSMLFLVFVLYFFIKPLAVLSTRDLKLKHISNRTINIISAFIVIFSLLDFVEVFRNFQSGFTLMLVDDSYGAGLYRELRYGDNFDTKSNTISFLNSFGVISNIVRGVSPLFCLYYFTRDNKKLWITIGLLLSMVMDIMVGISIGSRLKSIATIMNIIGMALFLYPLYSNKIKK